MEEITTRDETSTVCTNGARALPSGALSMDGPPTTLSGTGIDHMAFLQTNITRDNTKFVNGTPIGDRDVFQVLVVYLLLHSISSTRILMMSLITSLYYHFCFVQFLLPVAFCCNLYAMLSNHFTLL